MSSGGKSREEIENEIQDCKRWVNFFRSSLTHNPWDAYLEEKMRSIKRFEKRIRRLENELEKTNKGG